MIQDNSYSMAVDSKALVGKAPFNIKPLMAAYMTCTMAITAFVSLIEPLARSLCLVPG